MKNENKFLSTVRDIFSYLGIEAINGIRDRYNQDIDDAVFNETILGIDKATCAMLEIGIDESLISNQLVKHWDLRPIEAKSFIDFHKQKSIE